MPHYSNIVAFRNLKDTLILQYFHKRWQLFYFLCLINNFGQSNLHFQLHIFLQELIHFFYQEMELFQSIFLAKIDIQVPFLSKVPLLPEFAEDSSLFLFF